MAGCGKQANSTEAKEIHSIAWCCEYSLFFIHGSTDVGYRNLVWDWNIFYGEGAIFLNVENGGEGLNVRKSDPFLQSYWITFFKMELTEYAIFFLNYPYLNRLEI